MVNDEKHTFVFDGSDGSEARGTVEVSRDYCGVDIKVVHQGTTWQFLLDLYHLTGDGQHDGSVQVVAYNPQDQDGDPLQHLKVWPDGRFETFDA